MSENNKPNKIKSIFNFIAKPFKYVYSKFMAYEGPRWWRNLTSTSAYTQFVDFTGRYSLVVNIFYSCFVCFVIEWLARHSFSEGIDFVIYHTKPFIYNSFVVFVILTLGFLFKRRFFARLALTALIMIFGIVNSIILAKRITPFGFTDLYMVGDLLTMKGTSYFTRGEALLFFFGAVVVIFMLFIINRKCRKVRSSMKLPIRIVLIVAAFASLPVLTNVLQSQNIMASYFGNLAQGYRDYGFIYGFGMSVFNRGMSKPLFYDQNSVDEILAKTAQPESTISGTDGPNVIVVLLESFYDVSETNFIKTDQDPIPFFHSLQQNYSTGHLTVPVVGAGTCNTEFEVLTGMSCQFLGPGEYPQKTILKEISCESYAENMNNLGYGSHVVHNNGGNFYSRRNAFSQMGFDTFTSSEMLDITEFTPLGSWAMDDCLIDATKNALDFTPNSRDFVYTITVETHGTYPTEKIIENPEIQVFCEGKTLEEQNQWEYYVNMIHDQDRVMQEYISMLEQRDEETLVIFFGDHLPTMGLKAEDQATGDLYKTGYFTWNNFGMEKQDVDYTSYQLVSAFLDRLGVHGGTILDYNQTMTKDGVPAGSYAYMDGLEMLQYDLLYGKQYAYHGSPHYASNLIMGTQPIEISKLYNYNGTLHIYGENFTPSSRVYINDSPVATTYMSGQVLKVNSDEVESGSSVQVLQLGSGNSEFRRSNRKFYYESPEDISVVVDLQDRLNITPLETP